MTTGDESQVASVADTAEPEKKKKTSVKVVKRIKSKKSEKAPELAPAPEQIAPEVAEPPKVDVSSFPGGTARRVSSKRRAQRTGSNVFAMFTQNQVHQFKEAFSFIDQDKDGIISKSDIRATFDALGRLCSDKELEEMTSEAPGLINFTMFLSVFGDRVQGTDEEEVVQKAFMLYDEGDGFCHEDK